MTKANQIAWLVDHYQISVRMCSYFHVYFKTCLLVSTNVIMLSRSTRVSFEFILTTSTPPGKPKIPGFS